MKIVALMLLLSVTASWAEGLDDPAPYPPPTLEAGKVQELVAAYLNERKIALNQWRLEMLSFDYMQRKWMLTYFPIQEKPLPGLVTIVVSDSDPAVIEFYPAK